MLNYLCQIYKNIKNSRTDLTSSNRLVLLYNDFSIHKQKQNVTKKPSN